MFCRDATGSEVAHESGTTPRPWRCTRCGPPSEATATAPPCCSRSSPTPSPTACGWSPTTTCRQLLPTPRIPAGPPRAARPPDAAPPHHRFRGRTHLERQVLVMITTHDLFAGGSSTGALTIPGVRRRRREAMAARPAPASSTRRPQRRRLVRRWRSRPQPGRRLVSRWWFVVILAAISVTVAGVAAIHRRALQPPPPRHWTGSTSSTALRGHDLSSSCVRPVVARRTPATWSSTPRRRGRWELGAQAEASGSPISCATWSGT